MKVLVIGAGNMGAAFVKQLSAAGHTVSVAAKSSSKAVELAKTYPNTTAVTLGAPSSQDVVVLATSYADAAPALKAAKLQPGQTVIDISNPLTPDYMGLTIGHSTSAAEELAKALPDAGIVKGFNTLFAQVLANGPVLADGRKAPVFLASDNASAKGVARELAQSLGFAVIDAGPLKNARYLEPVAGLNIYLGYGAGLGTGISPAWLGLAQ